MTSTQTTGENSSFDSLSLLADRKTFWRLHAVLVGVKYRDQKQTEVDEHLDELKLLTDTYGIPVVGIFSCPLRSYSARTFLTTGKLEELRETIAETGANLVIFDDEISPGQQRNLEKELKVPVIDRTEVILGVFAERARSREARLQIALAQVKYMYPRLKRMWTHLSRQVGGGGGATGGGYLKGAGEKQIEIDRRMLKRRMEFLERQIRDIKTTREVRRGLRKRTDIPVFALVGYTNVGKSTLMNALTEAGVYVEDKLFATLDTTTRRLMLPNKQEVLLIDTVGFIRKLPHLLVAAFRSTLEEAVQANIIVHLIDASHPAAFDQAQTTLQVLEELNPGEELQLITILNKIDEVRTLDPASKQYEIYQKLRLNYPRVQEISAKEKIGFDDLLQEMVQMVAAKRVHLSLRIPQSEYHFVADAIRSGHVLHQEYDENDILLEVELPEPQVGRFKIYMQNKKTG